jgi:hypothetical protein
MGDAMRLGSETFLFIMRKNAQYLESKLLAFSHACFPASLTPHIKAEIGPILVRPLEMWTN